MSFFSIIETLFIGPLKLVFEIIFGAANEFIGHPGIAIVFLSLMMNILVLPLYRRADAMQEQARDIEMKLHDGVAHIKKTFSGDERMMILQTYYRQNNYKPTQALNGSVSLLLEIPFFMAAYQFLSNLDILNGVSFGPIKDLGAPDALIAIGSFSINLLPILMTLINVISSYLYLKGFPLKTKIQLYAMAAFFLVFLYTSPSCLVFYWTLNNVFSLVKTIFYKLKNPQKVLRVLTTSLGAVSIAGGFIYSGPKGGKISLFVIGALLLIPLIIHLLKGKIVIQKQEFKAEPSKKLFILGSLFLTVLIGLLIPSAFISASPQEYVDVGYFHNPLWYIVSALCFAAGTFLVWMRVFYWLASDRGKVIFDKLVWILCGLTLVNYMFFGTELGVVSSILQYENGVSFSVLEQIINVFVIIVLIVGLFIVITKFKRITATVLLTAIIAIGGMSAVNIVAVKSSVDEIVYEDALPGFNLSKNGKNVIVIMLDRAMGEYIPFIFNEKPELKEQFSGFTYYKNTISFGGYTNFGSPALLGGYEYTPVEMNKRKDETLVSKHNEAHKVMPTLFAQNGYEVTVCDPVYTNYKWIPDLSVFDGEYDIDAYITKGKFGDIDQKKKVVENNRRNFFCFSLMKSMPLALQPSMYDGGQYNQISSEENMTVSSQTIHSISSSTGLSSTFMEPYNVLENLSNITNITNDGANTFLFFSNDVTHEPMLLKEPEYVPAQNVDNTVYNAEHAGRFTVDGKTLKVETVTQMIHYQANMSALMRLGEWFDHMRENGVYDNTKIILTSDHGRYLGQMDELNVYGGVNSLKNIEHYYPLLMVKDFGGEGFTTSDEFMTNADVPTLAFKDVINEPVNPFTKKAINSDEKTAHDQFVILSSEWDVAKNNGNTYLAAKWASVKENMWDKDNWTFYNESIVLDEHSYPTED